MVFTVVSDSSAKKYYIRRSYFKVTKEDYVQEF